MPSARSRFRHVGCVIVSLPAVATLTGRLLGVFVA
jgi:hypothetical protein